MALRPYKVLSEVSRAIAVAWHRQPVQPDSSIRGIPVAIHPVPYLWGGIPSQSLGLFSSPSFTVFEPRHGRRRLMDPAQPAWQQVIRPVRADAAHSADAEHRQYPGRRFESLGKPTPGGTEPVPDSSSGSEAGGIWHDRRSSGPSGGQSCHARSARQSLRGSRSGSVVLPRQVVPRNVVNRCGVLFATGPVRHFGACGQVVGRLRRWWVQASLAAHLPGFGARRHPTVGHVDDLASSVPTAAGNEGPDG
jgi:hypothetical protein